MSQKKLDTKANTTFIEVISAHATFVRFRVFFFIVLNCFILYYIILGKIQYWAYFLVISLNQTLRQFYTKGQWLWLNTLIADCRPWKERQEGGSQWTVPVFSGHNDLKQTLWVTWWIVSSWPIVSFSKGKVVRMVRLTLPFCAGLEHDLPIIKTLTIRSPAAKLFSDQQAKGNP